MKIAVTIDDDLVQRVMEVANRGLETPSDLIREAMQTYVRVQAARQLADMGGEMHEKKQIPRRDENRDLNKLIIKCVDKKEGSREFALFYMLDGEPVWKAMLGNEQVFAPLGESCGEFQGRGTSAEEAVESLYRNLLSGILNKDYDWLLVVHQTPWLNDFAAEEHEYTWDDEDQLYSDLMTWMQSKENPALKG
ncbi:type II toxin-antitoxin system VapB family antitoxin [Halomonas sp. TRM85114]|uniref:type II toxin-antitoxin system VapB family antitoxin n=1 Tax=Halomonas jincaotanensis TaxID=2810616 RepID=UPI001BD59E1D|nr:type II toxin-antitoxin system VapB family antitoxin [Halomonas jincaotanensis]MBS9405376.1 type II toxin-antitoxin system VapB family antitoxin [Halomonas jincaotanensis]